MNKADKKLKIKELKKGLNGVGLSHESIKEISLEIKKLNE